MAIGGHFNTSSLASGCCVARLSCLLAGVPKRTLGNTTHQHNTTTQEEDASVVEKLHRHLLMASGETEKEHNVDLAQLGGDE